MKVTFFFILFGLSSLSLLAQSRFSRQELAVNAFRNPSVGLEYRHRQVSVHGGYYPTIISQEAGRNVTTSFVRAGVSVWYLPVGQRQNPSSFYSSVSYLRGLDRDYDGTNAVLLDTGFRWMIWQGLNLRVGVAALKASGRDWKINPTPGISYSFFFR
ncbi:hypothetical protein [Tellurirhabdus rosea]|uniref:hypothetical protein n=1 Tax=Tellurirhabdus rosea TaxID=2674997 RepID=UPI002252CB7C|nr:hypothetical protein [Tellurirhabdus rosea]